MSLVFVDLCTSGKFFPLSGLSCSIQQLDEILHVEAQRVEGGCPALVVLLVDGDSGQAATHSPFLVDNNLCPGSKVLLKEMGHGGAPNPSSNNSSQDSLFSGLSVTNQCPVCSGQTQPSVACWEFSYRTKL